MENKIKKFLIKHHLGIAAWLFGSTVKKPENPHDDLDLAILFAFSHEPAYPEMVEWRESLSSLLKKPVDLVIMNRANPILKFQVFRYGQKILDREEKTTTRFIVQSLMEYYDIQKMRAPFYQQILKGRRYGG